MLQRKKIKKFHIFLAVLCLVAGTLGYLFFPGWKFHQPLPLPTEKQYNFFVITDFGTVVHHYNKPKVAKQMQLFAAKTNPQFIISSGDNFHTDILKAVQDTAWQWDYGQFFRVGNIKDLDWYAALGNHDYTGNPEAEIAYGTVDKHWHMPARYYTFTKQTPDGTSLRFIILDTSPFVKSYRKRVTHKDVAIQNTDRQLAWLDSVLSTSKERWKVVIGHHPIYHSGFFSGNTPELIDQVKPILKKYNVDFYFSGHVHTFQHNQIGGIDYVTTASAWKTRMVTPWFYTRFWKSATGFTICSVDHSHFAIYFINEKEELLYSYARKKS